MIILIIAIFIVGCRDDGNSESYNTKNDDTLHITSNEFMNRYNKNLEVYCTLLSGKEFYNALKIEGVKTENGKYNDTAYIFDIAFPTNAFSDKKDNGKINNLTIEFTGNDSNSFILYSMVMSLYVYSLSNKNTISKAEDLNKISTIINNLLKQATNSSIPSNGKASLLAETNYNDIKISIFYTGKSLLSIISNANSKK